MQQPHLNIIWWQLIVFVNILQIFLVPRYDEHLITCSILLFLFRYFQSSLVGRFLLGSYISDCMPVYILIVLVISDLFLMQAGKKRKKFKIQKSKKDSKSKNPKINTPLCDNTKTKRTPRIQIQIIFGGGSKPPRLFLPLINFYTYPLSPIID